VITNLSAIDIYTGVSGVTSSSGQLLLGTRATSKRIREEGTSAVEAAWGRLETLEGEIATRTESCGTIAKTVDPVLPMDQGSCTEIAFPS
jgi:hypothetical protein